MNKSHTNKPRNPQPHKPSVHNARIHKPSSHSPQSHKPSRNQPSHSPQSHKPSHKQPSHKPQSHKPPHKPPSSKAQSHQTGHAPATHIPIRFVSEGGKTYRISFVILFTIFLIFTGGLGTAYSYAYIYDIQTQISRQRTELANQKESNAALRAMITQKYTLDEVARIASERLGMNKPDISQIIYIHVPKQSYVILNDEEDTLPVGLWQELTALFSRIFKG